jgi:hypothetical protein
LLRVFTRSKLCRVSSPTEPPLFHARMKQLSLLLSVLPLAVRAMRAPAAFESPVVRLEEAIEKLQERIRGPVAGGAIDDRAAVMIGTWTKDRTENMDVFLDEALGVGGLKRKLALKAGQTQGITFRRGVVHLDMTDRRGTKKHEMHPHGRVLQGKGFVGLPVKRRVVWARDGSLVMTEQYSQHLGGEEDGQPCKGDSCPVVRSRRSVSKGVMTVELERKLLSGNKVGMKTHYKRVALKKKAGSA